MPRQDPGGEQGHGTFPYRPFGSATGYTCIPSSNSSTCPLPKCNPSSLPSAKVNRTMTSVIYRALPPRLAPSPSVIPAAAPSSRIYIKNSFITCRCAEVAACFLQPFSSSGDFYTTKDLQRGQGQDAGRDPSRPACDMTTTAGLVCCLPVPVAGADGGGGPDGSRDVPSAVRPGKHLTGTCSHSDNAAVKPSPHSFEKPPCTHAVYPAFDFSGFPQCSDSSFWAFTPTASA